MVAFPTICWSHGGESGGFFLRKAGMTYTVAVLFVCTVLFALRVAGQVIVVLWAPRWLPSMEHWYSELMPYRYLLPAQLVLLSLMAVIAADVYRTGGFFASSWWGIAATPLRLAAVVYFASMIVRYVLTMKLRPERRWLKRTIPIWFHMVLATALWSFGGYHSI